MIKLLKKIAKDIRDIFITVRTFILSYYGKQNNKICLLVTNGMGYGGAPLVLMEAAFVYKEQGYDVIIYSEYCGELLGVCKKNDISVWLNPKKNKRVINNILNIRYEFALVNTIVMYKWVEKLSEKGIPVLWWLHESDTYINEISAQLPNVLEKKVKVLTVSDRTVKSLERNGIKYNTDMLFYGIKDLNKGLSIRKRNQTNNFVTILVIGTICKRKNQLFAIDAIEKYKEVHKKDIQLLFVGTPLKTEKLYYEEFLNRIVRSKFIKYVPKVQRKEIEELYRTVDILLCCSIDDPLPVVVTECFMFKKIVIASSEVGQFPLIEDGFNGFTFDINDITSLCNAVDRACVALGNNEITEQARVLYEQHFSKESFEKNLLKYTMEVLN